MKEKNAYTAKEISQLLGIYIKTLDYWVKTEILAPGVYFPKGRGTTRLFSTYNVYEAAIIRELVKDELPLAFVKRVLDVLQRRQFLDSFSYFFSGGIEDDIPTYLVWKRNYAKESDVLKLVELRDTKEFDEFGFGAFERVTVFNLSLMCHRIFAELDDSGVTG
jgi:DNA-binding transcriptional MerR regulator